MDYSKESLILHEKLKGKLDIVPKIKINDKNDLSLAYTPGVAAPCLEIQKDYEKSFTLTGRGNLVAVITDGTAVLGLGDIGPEAGMPVMEGKCLLLKEFGGVNAVPICVRSKDVDEIVKTIKLIAGSFGGINLEDISAPRCFEVERKLIEDPEVDIPVFHDDQHGTAIVVGAAVTNSLKFVGKEWKDVRIVISGAGSAGIAIAKMMLALGTGDVVLYDRCGVLYEGIENVDDSKKEIAKVTNKTKIKGGLKEALCGADVFVGVSAGGIVSEEMIKSMNKNAIVFPMANPVPEIMPELAISAGAKIVGTGRSDFPNQINNLLVFPGIFRGALDCRAKEINAEMKIAAAKAIASLIPENELRADYIIPSPFDKRVAPTVAKAVAESALKSKVCKESN